MSHEPDDPHDDAVHEALERWQPPGPPAGFADRVDVATLGAGRSDRRRSRWPLVVVAVAAVAAAAAVVVVAWPSAPPASIVVARRAYAARETVALGGRGVAVAEPGAAFGWRQDGAALSVRQESGDVFYRVDRASPARFTVTTPAGEIHVTGTCFRVEVIPMPTKASLIGAAAGAVSATAAVVTVYEGKVLVASPSGQAEVKAGEKVTLDGAPPRPAAVAGPTVAIAVPSEPSATITREELLVRDQAQREQIAALSGRLAQLEGAIAAGGGKVRKHPGGPDGDGDWLNPTKEELLALAQECGVKIDLPPVMRGELMTIDPGTAESVGLTAEEVTQANQAFAELASSWKSRVRGWYVEATGDHQGADQLSPHSMGEELQDKALPGEQAALQKRISHERAGLLPAPADLGRASPYERYFRALADLGNEAERVIGAKIGAEKAHKIRAENGGWGMRMSIAGCEDESDQDADR